MLFAHRKPFFWLYPALLISIFLPSLLDLGYWPLDAEVLLVSVTALCIGVLLAAITTKVPSFNNLLVSILFYCLLDAFFFHSSWLAVLGGIFCFCFLRSGFRPNIVSMLLAFSVVWTVLALLQPTKNYLDKPLENPLKNTSTHLPVIMHLILDEQMSPKLADQSSSLAIQNMLHTYEENEFMVMSRAESVSSQTQYSISDLFALRMETRGRNVKEGRDGFTHGVLHNHYFDVLKKAGYRITTIQSSFLQFCHPSSDVFCATYSRAGHGHSMTRFSGKMIDRMQSVLLEMHYRFYEKKTVATVGLYRGLAKMSKRIFAIEPKQKNVFYTRPAAVLNMLDDIERVLQTAHGGTAYVFHLLLPHFPYVLDERCQLKSADDWQVPHRHSNVVVDAHKIYQGYWQQTECVHQHVQKIVTQLESNPASSGAIVIVHGDHGARIERGKEDISFVPNPDDLQTFLAIKHPQKSNFPAKEDDAPVILQDAFADAIDHLFN